MSANAAAAFVESLRAELRVLWRDGRARWGVALLAVLFLAAVAAQAVAVRTERGAAIAAAAAERERWLAQPEKYAHSAAHYGVWAFRPSPPLGALDPGITPYVGGAVWMEAHLQNEPLHRPAQDAGTMERFGRLTPAVVVGVLAPLLILLLGYGSVAAERERGTWPLVRVQARGTGAIHLAKAVALFLLATLALAPGLALALGATAAGVVAPGMPAATAPGDVALRTLGWIAAALAYVALTAALVVAASSVARSAATAFGFGLAAWVVATILVPRLATEAAARAVPLGTQQAFALELREELGNPSAEVDLERLRAETLARHGVARVEDLPVNWAGLRMQAGEEHGNRVFDREWGALHARIERQQSLARAAAVASPWLAFRSTSQELAGSSFAVHREFLAQAERHRREIQRIMNDEIVRHPERDGRRHLSGAELWGRVPEFRPTVPPLVAQRAAALPALGLLAAWALLAAAAFALAVRRDRRSAA